MSSAGDESPDFVADVIAAFRGGWGARCDFCHADKPAAELEPEEAGAWVCRDCLRAWEANAR